MKINLLVVLVVAALALHGSGCSRPDWIQETLVTVDVTGTWVRSEGGWLELKLEQRGPKVTGTMQLKGGYGGSTISGDVEGRVAHDVLRFRQTSGPIVIPEAEMTVSGDEMTGRLPSAAVGLGDRVAVVLRRVDSSRPTMSRP